MGGRLERVTDWSGLAEKAHYNARELASVCQMSLRQLERHFRCAFKQSPQAWLDTARIEKARQLLLNTTLSIKEIALSLDFKQTSHFSRQFKQCTGASPTTFVQLQLRGMGPEALLQATKPESLIPKPKPALEIRDRPINFRRMKMPFAKRARHRRSHCMLWSTASLRTDKPSSKASRVMVSGGAILTV
jgi:AraC-like DNA-binding protein